MVQRPPLSTAAANAAGAAAAAGGRQQAMQCNAAAHILCVATTNSETANALPGF